MAALSSFGITVLLSGSVTNPINSSSFQVVAPWGKSAVCATMGEAISAVFEGKAGSMYAGKMGSFFTAQTNNAATLLGGQTGTYVTTSGVVTGLTSTAGLQVGWGVFGANAPANATIASVNSSTQITMSANGLAATSAATYFVPQSILTGMAVAANEVGQF